jgi:SEC-C motif-containing protein
VAPEPGLEWVGLEVLDVAESGDSGVVEFRAHWVWQGRRGVLHERSTFERRAGRWLYVDGAAPGLRS